MHWDMQVYLLAVVVHKQNDAVFYLLDGIVLLVTQIISISNDLFWFLSYLLRSILLRWHFDRGKNGREERQRGEKEVAWFCLSCFRSTFSKQWRQEGRKNIRRMLWPSDKYFAFSSFWEMFNRLFESIRTHINTAKSDTEQDGTRHDSTSSGNARLRKTMSTPVSIGQQHTYSQHLQPPEPMNIRARRKSSIFGLSQVSADDYMQKDLLSSSWSWFFYCSV